VRRSLAVEVKAVQTEEARQKLLSLLRWGLRTSTVRQPDR
jgi:hypothetical protein